jgi:transcriptional regulator with XRE-family HTH domain
MLMADTGGIAFGKVALWGKVQEYFAGFRAEFAAPVDPIFFYDNVANYAKFKWDIPELNERYQINAIGLNQEVQRLLGELSQRLMQSPRQSLRGTSQHQLRETRRAHKPYMSITDLATMIGMSSAWVSNVERGVIRVKPGMQAKIAAVFKMKPEDIFTPKKDKAAQMNIYMALDETVLGPHLEEMFG